MIWGSPRSSSDQFVLEVHLLPWKGTIISDLDEKLRSKMYVHSSVPKLTILIIYLKSTPITADTLPHVTLFKHAFIPL